MPIKTRRKIAAVRTDPRLIGRFGLISELWRGFSRRWKRSLPDFCLVSDEAYYKPSRSEVARIVKAWAATHPRYVGERFDCDDYAWTLKAHFSKLASRSRNLPAAYAVGIIWTETSSRGLEGHAYNWAYLSDNKVWLIEPQTGEMWQLGKKVRKAGDPNYDSSVCLVCG